MGKLTWVCCVARFADYIVTMPLIVLLLGQVAAADIATIAATIGAACKFALSKQADRRLIDAILYCARSDLYGIV